MTHEQLKAFLSKAKDDTVLQEKLKAADSPEVVVALAKEHGHDFGTDHMSQLTEEELERVDGAGRTDLGMATRCTPFCCA